MTEHEFQSMTVDQFVAACRLNEQLAADSYADDGTVRLKLWAEWDGDEYELVIVHWCAGSLAAEVAGEHIETARKDSRCCGIRYRPGVTTCADCGGEYSVNDCVVMGDAMHCIGCVEERRPITVEERALLTSDAVNEDALV